MQHLKSFVRKLKVTYENYYSLIHNFGYLSILQILNLVLPLLTYPYLIKVLGTEVYGVIIYSQAIIGYLVVLVNFGFNITATKDISVNRNDPKKLNEIISSIFIIKGILFIVSVIFLKIFLFYSTDSSKYSTLFYLTLWMCVNEFLFPIWYFQGIEKMKYITILSSFSRITFLLLIFLLVKSKNDYLMVPIINGVGAIISCIVSIIILTKNSFEFRWQRYQTLTEYVKKAYIMAIAYVANIFKTNFNIIVIKNIFSLTEVVYFDMAIKIVNLGVTFLDLISQSVFPKMSISKDKIFFMKIMKISLYVSVGMTISIQLLAPILVKIISGKDFQEAIYLTRILAINLPVYIAGALLGRNCLLVNGYDKQILYSMAASSAVYLLLVVTEKTIYKNPSLVDFAYIYIISFSFETLYRYLVCKNKNII